MKLPPPGAIPEDERARLETDGFHNSYKHGYYAVLNRTGELGIGGKPDIDGKPHTYCLSWSPKVAYYFRNYFFALAYSIRVKEELAKKK